MPKNSIANIQHTLQLIFNKLYSLYPIKYSLYIQLYLQPKHNISTVYAPNNSVYNQQNLESVPQKSCLLPMPTNSANYTKQKYYRLYQTFSINPIALAI